MSILTDKVRMPRSLSLHSTILDSVSIGSQKQNSYFDTKRRELQDIQVDVDTNNLAVVEALRFEKYSLLRKRLFGLVREAKCDSRRGWIRAFQRWQINHDVLTHSTIFQDAIEDDDDMVREFLIPSSGKGNADILVRSRKLLEIDLAALENMSPAAAVKISQILCLDSLKLVKNFHCHLTKVKQRQECKQEDDSDLVEVLNNNYNDDKALRLDTKRAAERLHVDPRTFKRRNMLVSSKQLQKLRTLWDLSRSEAERTDLNAKSDTDEALFFRDVYTLATRYEALEGRGWQAAIPNNVMECLKNKFGVSAELMASPFNTRTINYCSVFPDIEHRFHSMGSFFDFHPTEGGYEVNPPFSEFLMVAMIKHITNLLKNEEAKALSFVIVVPAWGIDYEINHYSGHIQKDKQVELLQYEMLLNRFLNRSGDSTAQSAGGGDIHFPLLDLNPFHRTARGSDKPLIIPQEEHTYVDEGSAENRRQSSRITVYDEIKNKYVTTTETPEMGITYRLAAFDSALFVLQNDKGAKKWPVTKQKLNAIAEAWKQNAPSQSSVNRGNNKYVPNKGEKIKTSI